MLFELNRDKKYIEPVSSLTISTKIIGGDEKMLEEYLKKSIGDIVFPQYLVIGNQREFQKEPALFAVDSEGNLIIFELKVGGEYDRGKVYQVLDYAQHFSFWRYREMNEHFKKCFSERGKELSDVFEEHFGFKINESDFNRKQKAIIISHSSSNEVHQISKYWKNKGVEIEEYFYRFYTLDGTDKIFFELSNELVANQTGYSCWINTCRTYFPDAYIDMIKKQKAAAYDTRLGVIGSWMNNGIVFLYHNGHGIIGVGKGTAKIEESYCEKYSCEERAVRLSHFRTGVNIETQEIESSIPPYRIKELLKRNFYFATSSVPLTEKEGEILLKECEKIFKYS